MIDPPTPSISSSPSTPIAQSSVVHAVAVKLPPFWPNDPVVWFAQVETQFLTRNITSQATQFAYVVSSLQPEIAQEVRDILLSPPINQPHDVIKSELIKRTSVSEQNRLRQLLISEELGDRKPSQLLRHMHQLLGDHYLEDGIMKQLFLQRLPTNLQVVLVSVDTMSLESLAQLADKIFDIAPSQSALASTSTSPSPSSAAPELADLRSQIASLTAQLTALVSQPRSNPRSRANSRSRSRGSSPAPARSDDFPRVCWYHRRFHAAARRCTRPCSFASSTNSNQQSENYQASD